MSRREILIAAAIRCSPGGRITTWVLVKRAPQRVAHAIKCPTGEEGSPTWSPDGKRIAFGQERKLRHTDRDHLGQGGPTRELTKGYGVPSQLVSGWKKTILYRSKSGFSIVSVDGGGPRLIRKDDGDMGASWFAGRKADRLRSWACSHSRSGEGFHSTMYTMKPDGTRVRRLLGTPVTRGTPDWSPSGRFLVFACTKGFTTCHPATAR